MTSRDTHDIAEYEHERTRMEIADDAHRAYEETGEPPKILKSFNIQPRMVAELLARSEPSLFTNDAVKATEVVTIPGWTPVAVALMHEAIRWHAELQVSFFKELYEEELV